MAPTGVSYSTWIVGTISSLDFTEPMMDAREFIGVAGKIAGFGRAGARSAVSRAYYGAFHVATSILKDCNCAPRNSKSHGEVPRFLGYAGSDEAKEAGALLLDLHGERVRADYHLDDGGAESLSFAQLGIETANEILNLLGMVAAKATHPDAKAAIRSSIRAKLVDVNQLYLLGE